jgi:hypothetical protein
MQANWNIVGLVLIVGEYEIRACREFRRLSLFTTFGRRTTKRQIYKKLLGARLSSSDWCLGPERDE